jgi:hypothetical protein
MRTTLSIDDDVFELARSLAEARRVSIGKALSDLARRGTQARTPSVSKSGFFTFNVPERLPSFGPEDVQAALDAEDAEFAAQFLKPRSR